MPALPPERPGISVDYTDRRWSQRLVWSIPVRHNILWITWITRVNTVVAISDLSIVVAPAGLRMHLSFLRLRWRSAARVKERNLERPI